jgi:membrane-bound lytic murein transglycosylase D
MSKKYQIKIVIFFLTLIFCGNFKIVNATSECNANNEIREKVLNLPLQLELKYNDQVKEQIEFFVDKNKKLSSALLGRATMYFPMIEATLATHNLPDELKYLPVIEAGLVPYLTSSAGASGLWQFMPATAQQFGLKITNTIDERRDANKSTQAAAVYLKRLFNIYKDWTLVLAAYNCGDGVLNKAMKKTASRSYWDIQQYLPQQTQEFVPKFIAAAYMMNYYYDHNISPIPMEDDYVFTASIKVFDKVELQKVADDYQINIEVLKRLNAVYTKGFVPASDGEYLLHLPESKIYDFASTYNLFDNIVAYSPASMSRQKQAIAEAEAKNQQDIKSRESLPIDGLPLSNNPIVDAKPSSIRFDEEISIKVVKLTKGKSLLDIAKENGTDIASLIDLNKIDSKYPPKIGDEIKVRI